MRIKAYLLLIIPLTLWGCGGGSGGSPTSSPPPQPPTQAAPDFGQVQAEIDRHSVADMALIIGNKDGELFRYEKGDFRVNSAVNIASATKLYTGLGVWSLIEAGTVSLDTQPQDHIDFWTNDSSDDRSKVTLASLMSFTSGFNAPPSMQSCPGDARFTLEQCIRVTYNDGIETEPNKVFSYGPEHMQIAALMAKNASGVELQESIQTNIFDKAGTSPATAFPQNRGDNVRYSGGAISTAEDYGKVLTALMAGDLIANLSGFLTDRTVGTELGFELPAISESSLDWHYAFGFWKECDAVPYQPSCDDQPTISSPGAFGFLPWVDFENGYWAVIAMEEKVSISSRPSVDSVNLEQILQPLIEDALD